MNKENQIHKRSEVWNILTISGYLVIILSFIGGLYILNEFGTIDVPTTAGISLSETNVIGIASGFAVMIQGLITGIVLIAFSTLGKSVDQIKNYLINKDD
jgi:hypothetical protein